MASNEVEGVRTAPNPVEAVKAYNEYVKSMEAARQTPKDIRDL